MNEYSNRGTVAAVNVKDLVWDLLKQWKAILIVALLMTILITGLKYIKETKTYKADLAKQKEAAEIASLSVEEQLDKMLNSLPEDQRNTVEYMVEQKEWLNTQKTYINNSILLNVDPTNQRTVILDYYISTADESNSIATSLAYGYSSYVTSDAVIDGLHEIINPNVEKKYIAELVSTPFINNNNGANSIIAIGADDGDIVLEVKVVVPENVDSAAVESVITKAFTDYSEEFAKSAGGHTIKLIRSNEAHLYNSIAVQNRNSIISNIYNIQINYIKNMETSLTDEQKAAVETILTIKAAEANDETVESMDSDETDREGVAKPGLSKKYACAGCMLGIILYALFYVLNSVLKGRIASAGQTEYFTRGRLLGEVYYTEKHSGLNALLHSKLVDSIKFRGKLDTDMQISKLASATGAVCKHAETDTVTVFRMPGEACKSVTADEVIDKIRSTGVDVEVTDIDESPDCNELLEAKNAIIMACKDSRANDLAGLAAMLNEFDVPLLGNIYIENL